MKLSNILHKIFPLFNQNAKNSKELGKSKNSEEQDISKNSEEKGKPEFIIHDTDDEYIKDRLGRFIIFFDKERELLGVGKEYYNIQ